MLRYFFIICFLLACCGCRPDENVFNSFSEKYSIKDFRRATFSFPVSHEERDEFLRDLHKAFSEQNKNMAFELYKKSSGDEKVKYLLIYLAFNKQCMKVWEHQRINSIILENINDELILQLLDEFYLCSCCVQRRDEVLLENISLLCKNRPESLSLSDLIIYRYDLNNIGSVIHKISLDNLVQAERIAKQYMFNAQKNKRIEIENYYKQLLFMLNREIQKRLEDTVSTSSQQ